MPQKEYEANQLINNCWAIQVPEAAYDFFIEGNRLSFWSKGALHTLDRYLPPGSWQFLFTTKGATEEQAKQVVEKSFDGYVDYDKEGFHSDIPYAYARQSLDSLLKAKGLDVNKNYAILKLNDNEKGEAI